MPAAKIQKNRGFSVMVPPISLCKGVETDGLSARAEAVWALATGQHSKNQDPDQKWPHKPTIRKVLLELCAQKARK